MSGPEFFQTRMGMRFFEMEVPRAIRAIERLADAVAQRQSQPVSGVIQEPVPPQESDVVKMRRALKLVVAIADYPNENPDEMIVLSPKTREQINKALRESDGS